MSWAAWQLLDFFFSSFFLCVCMLVVCGLAYVQECLNVCWHMCVLVFVHMCSVYVEARD